VKRDLQINYGVLDDIIAELHTYKHALANMRVALNQIAAFVKENQAESMDALEEKMKNSKDHIADYEAQIKDLLKLFENYVSDTTAIISPIARNAMMRVDRNDIYFNLKQIESGINGNVTKAINITYKSPFSWAFWDEPTDEEKAASRYNKGRMDSIREDIQQVKKRLDRKIDELWGLYHSKVKKFENMDDEYKSKAATLKSKYTSFLEGLWDVVSSVGDAAFDLVRGLVVGLVEIGVGVVTLAVDVGIMIVSGIIPDPIEPDILKQSANEKMDAYTDMLVQAIKDPMGVLESIGQSISDTVEEEGIMYVTGYGASAFVPIVGQARAASVVRVGRSALNQKVRDIVRNHKAFEGFKTKPVEFVRNAMNEVAGGIRALQHQLNHRLVPAMSEVPNTPINTLSTRALMNTADETLSRVVGKGTGESVNFGKYSTSIDDKVKVIEKVDLPDWIRDSFTDRNYRTVITEENITFYRTFGGGAKANGSFVTTSPAGNRINAKIDTALVPDWKNTREFEAVIEVPKGQILNIGRVEKQYTKTGALLKGDGDQILLPQGWPSEWIKDIRKVPSK